MLNATCGLDGKCPARLACTATRTSRRHAGRLAADPAWDRPSSQTAARRSPRRLAPAPRMPPRADPARSETRPCNTRPHIPFAGAGSSPSRIGRALMLESHVRQARPLERTQPRQIGTHHRREPILRQRLVKLARKLQRLRVGRARHLQIRVQLHRFSPRRTVASSNSPTPDVQVHLDRRGRSAAAARAR